MSHIFMSHVEEDKGVAEQFAKALEGKGYRTWYFERDSRVTESYLDQASQAIESGEIFLLIISRASLKSSNVDREIDLAYECQKRMIPVLVDLSLDDFRRLKPKWRLAIGTQIYSSLQPGGVEAVLPRIVQGLENMGVKVGPVRRKDKTPETPVTPSSPTPPTMVEAETQRIPGPGPRFANSISRSGVMIIASVVLLVGLGGVMLNWWSAHPPEPPPPVSPSPAGFPAVTLSDQGTESIAKSGEGFSLSAGSGLEPLGPSTADIEQLTPAKFNASSVYEPYTRQSTGVHYTHDPELVYDNDIDTSWAPKRHEYINSWIEFVFDKPHEITQINVIPGLASSEEGWLDNQRLKTAAFTFDNGEPRYYTFSDRRRWQTYDVDPLVTATTVRMTVVSVYPDDGTPEYYDELLISEIEVYGK